MLVSLAIGSVVAMAAVTFAGDHVRLLSITEDRLDMNQDGRAVLELLARDLRHAGLGVGYRADGEFAGLRRGAFSVPGGASFQANDRSFSAGGISVVTDDLGVRFALGDVRTITEFDATQGVICAGGRFASGEVVVLMAQHGQYAHTARLIDVQAGGCQDHGCADGCESFYYEFDSSYESGPTAITSPYTQGELLGGYEEVVYYVNEDDFSGLPSLFRADVSAGRPCSDASSCGAVVGTSVEALQVRVWMLDEALNTWIDVTAEPSITESAPLRVDLELVLRADREREGATRSIESVLAGGACYPGPCGSQDHHVRDVVRTSVEIRNAGRMQLK